MYMFIKIYQISVCSFLVEGEIVVDTDANTSIDDQSNEFKDVLFYKIDVEDIDSN